MQQKSNKELLDKTVKKCGAALEIIIFQGGRADAKSSGERQKRINNRH
jgi:hypothetical protein